MHKLMLIISLCVPALAAADETIIGGRLTPVVVPVPMHQGPEVGASFDVRFENDSGFTELGLGGHFSVKNGQDGSFWLEGGRSWYVSDADPGLYFGGGAQFRWVGAGGQTIPFGAYCYDVGVAAQAGLMFWRTQSTRMYAEVRVVQNLLPFGCKDNLDEPRDAPSSAWRTEIGLAVGFGF